MYQIHPIAENKTCFLVFATPPSSLVGLWAVSCEWYRYTYGWTDNNITRCIHTPYGYNKRLEIKKL